MEEQKAQSTLDAEPKRIKPRHRALMRRLIAGMTLTDACEDLGFSVSRASLIVNSELFQAEMKIMEAEVKKDFAEAEANRPTDSTRVALADASEKAAKTLKGALDDESAVVRVNAAKDILDRTGYAKEDKLKARVLVEPSQSLIDLLSRAKRDEEKDAEPDDE